MVLCGYCRKNVKPKMYLTWKGFIHGLGIFYLIYIITKIPQCPNCNFPMPRRYMVFAIRLSDRQRGWRYTPASDRQAESLVRWGVVPSIEWLRAREREVGVQLPGGAASDPGNCRR